MLCPRRIEGSVLRLPKEDRYEESDNTCSYCDSLDPDIFMSRLEAGDVKLTPTDKTYKVYIENDGGENFKQTYRNCPRDEEAIDAAGNHYLRSGCNKGPDACTHWVTREVTEHKFYFQHLSQEQRRRFIELLNGKKIKFNVPGYFYVYPYFITFVKGQGEADE